MKSTRKSIDGSGNKLDDDGFQWQEFLDITPQGMFALSENDDVFCNRVFRKLIGVTSPKLDLSEFIATLQILMSSNDFEDFCNWLERRETGEFSIPILQPVEKNYRLNITLVRSSDGRNLFGLVREISPFSEFEDSPWLLEPIFNGIEDGILILDPGSLIIKRSNEAAARIFGFTNDELEQKSVIDLVPGKDKADDVAAMISSRLPFLKSIHIDLEMCRSNGTMFPALNGITEISNNKGDVVAWMWIITDMTQRVVINRALVDLETRYRLLFDRTADPTLIIDSISKKIMDANVASERQLGYKHAELIGLTMEDITPEERLGEMDHDFSTLELGESRTIEGMNLTKSGVVIPVQISVIATDFEGRKVFIASCRDISQQKMLEQERLRIEKLDAVRKVTGGLAHEFSQPLQSLTTISDLLAQPDIPESQQVELIKKIEPSVVRMVLLLEQMKRIVRIETKPYTKAHDIVDIQHSVDEP